MSRVVPFHSSYSTIRKFEKTAFYCLLLSAILIGALWLFPKLNLTEQTRTILIPVSENLKILSNVSIIAYVILSFIAKFLFKSVESVKRNDLIDNSFGSNYSNDNTIGYYNNDEIGSGIKKLAVNSFESSFHTEHTLKLMLYKFSLKVMFFSLPFLLSIFSSGGEAIVRLLFEISIPMFLILQLITILIYYSHVKEINERFKVELINLGNKEIEVGDFPKLLIPVMEYYNTKSWAGINLDDQIFNKHNESISKKWVELKAKLKL